MTALILLGLVAMIFWDFSRPYAAGALTAYFLFQFYPVATVLIITAIFGIYIFIQNT